jgi:hypothetical protein
MAPFIIEKNSRVNIFLVDAIFCKKCLTRQKHRCILGLKLENGFGRPRNRRENPANERRKKMKKEELIQKIDAEIEDVREHWLADDGGLTMAASDFLAVANGLRKAVENNDAASVWLNYDQEAADTGPEQELISDSQYWAYKKIRRQIEDRLRKDDEFLERVIDLLHPDPIGVAFRRYRKAHPSHAYEREDINFDPETGDLWIEATSPDSRLYISYGLYPTIDGGLVEVHYYNDEIMDVLYNK